MEKNSPEPSGLCRIRYDSFNTINEKPVDDISLEVFYQPHTITALAVAIGITIYFAFVR